MEELVPEGRFESTRVVVDGDIITARAAGCAGEFAIAIIRALLGSAKADQIAQTVLLT
jgi:putative intracellular protease/amidase